MAYNYVLLTAAKDEAELIGEVIERVASQTSIPFLWVIVDDGSTDRTAEIVLGYAVRHPWIRLSPSGERNGRNFGSQYKALQAAYELSVECHLTSSRCRTRTKLRPALITTNVSCTGSNGSPPWAWPVAWSTSGAEAPGVTDLRILLMPPQVASYSGGLASRASAATCPCSTVARTGWLKLTQEWRAGPSRPTPICTSSTTVPHQAPVACGGGDSGKD